MFFKKRTQDSSQQTTRSFAEITGSLRKRWPSGIEAQYRMFLSHVAEDEDTEIPAWNGQPAFRMIRPLPTQLIDWFIAAVPSILEYLDERKVRDALVRELYADFVQKATYLSNIAGALDAIGEELERIDHEDDATKIAALIGLTEDFFNFESLFSEHKSLSTWHRLKEPLAGRMKTEAYNWLCHFYSNFSILAALCDQNNARAKAALAKIHQMLDSKINKKTAQKFAELVAEAISCLLRVKQGLVEFAESFK